MNQVKVYNQDGIIYFDNFRIKELLLLRSSENENKFLLTIDIQTYDYSHSEEEVSIIKKKLHEKINNELNYVWITLEECCEISDLSNFNKIELSLEDCEDKFLYFGWHIPLYNNKIKIEKKGDLYCLNWSATSDDVMYYDERAKENKVEIECDLKLYVFNSKEEWQKHDKLRDKQRDYYFDILNQLHGTVGYESKIEITEIKSEYSEKLKNELAWKIAQERIQL